MRPDRTTDVLDKKKIFRGSMRLKKDVYKIIRLCVAKIESVIWTIWKYYKDLVYLSNKIPQPFPRFPPPRPPT